FGSWREERNARWRLSGLQRGVVSLCGLEVTRTLRAPSQLTIQTSVSLLSASRSTLVTVYATHWPSGERCGSRTSRRRSRSSTVSGRLSAASADTAGARTDASRTRIAPAAGLRKRRVRPGWLMAPRLDEAPCYPDFAVPSAAVPARGRRRRCPCP